jgi:hypothetical protein
MDLTHTVVLDTRRTFLNHGLAEGFDEFTKALTTNGAGRLWMFRHRRLSGRETGAGSRHIIKLEGLS